MNYVDSSKTRAKREHGVAANSAGFINEQTTQLPQVELFSKMKAVK